MNSMGLIELAHRESDGVVIALWWNRRTVELKVTVRDHIAGDAFDVVAGAEEALDVFNHPYAYASTRNVLSWDLCQADAA